MGLKSDKIFVMIDRRIFLLLGLLLVLLMAVYLVGKRQEIRKGAFFSGVKVLVQPEVVNVALGEDMPVQLWLESSKVSGSEDLAKVSSMDVTLCFGSEIFLDGSKLDQLIELNEEAFKTLILRSLTKKGANESCLKIVALSTDTADKLKSGLFRAATIKFKAIRKGTGRLEVPTDRVFVAGYNPGEGAVDSSMDVGEARGLVYTVGESKRVKNCFFLWRWFGWCE